MNCLQTERSVRILQIFIPSRNINSFLQFHFYIFFNTSNRVFLSYFRHKGCLLTFRLKNNLLDLASLNCLPISLDSASKLPLVRLGKTISGHLESLEKL